MNRRVIGPFNRVEGDLEVQVDVQNGAVAEARVTPTLYRGFEQILEGKDPRDALVYAPRICGICSVSQSVAAAAALGDVEKIPIPPNGRLATNLIHAAENLADHLTHFYLFFMPDFARPVYQKQPWFAEAQARFTAVKGTAAAEILPIRAEFMNLLGLMAGKWPHTLAIQPGGTTKAVESQEKARLVTLLSDFRRKLERVLFGASLDTIAGFASDEALRAWAENKPEQFGDFRRFLAISDALDLDKLGRGLDRFLSYGAYSDGDGHRFARGVFEQGRVSVFDQADIQEDAASSWLAHRRRPRHPFDGITVPDADADGAYSWSKAPRLNGKTAEVGALARQIVDGHPLARDLGGGNVRARIVARMLEIARLALMMEDWARGLTPGEPFCLPDDVPAEGQGCGLVEAARGSLGHWVRISRGRIQNYQIVSPTTWNFSPRDRLQMPGPLEQALVGTPAGAGDADPIAVQHVVRSFDPCMVCTVH